MILFCKLHVEIIWNFIYPWKHTIGDLKYIYYVIAKQIICIIRCSLLGKGVNEIVYYEDYTSIGKSIDIKIKAWIFLNIFLKKKKSKGNLKNDIKKYFLWNCLLNYKFKDICDLKFGRETPIIICKERIVK